jgi:hypothetical protein
MVIDLLTSDLEEQAPPWLVGLLEEVRGLELMPL